MRLGLVIGGPDWRTIPAAARQELGRVFGVNLIVDEGDAAKGRPPLLGKAYVVDMDSVHPPSPLVSPGPPSVTPSPPPAAASPPAAGGGRAENGVPPPWGRALGDRLRSAIGVVRARAEHVRKWPECFCGDSVALKPGEHRASCLQPKLVEDLERTARDAEADLVVLLARLDVAEASRQPAFQTPTGAGCDPERNQHVFLGAAADNGFQSCACGKNTVKVSYREVGAHGATSAPTGDARTYAVEGKLTRVNPSAAVTDPFA